MNARFTILGLVMTAVLAGCTGKKASNPVVTDLRETERPTPALKLGDNAKVSGPNALKAIATEITLAKAEIFDRTFLYGSDLQYSAINDDKYQLTLQSMAVGHIPTYFRVVGRKLQLLADQRLGFESDVNHPERLIHEFSITVETETSLTIVIDKASPVLVTVLGGPNSGRERTSWVRSTEYVADGNYLMFETSIEGADGSIAEFNESLFPRETLVPEGYAALLADPSLESLANRFRFLTWGPVFMDVPNVGRVKTVVANRYNLAPGRAVDWYVTANIPDEFLPEIRTGIEGWNRYSQKMWGTDMVKFQGKLPDGIKLGDPRYNVVNWDNVAMAGAAYESQASDPFTGIQSHSLIYLPLAWVNIGAAYWEQGQFSDTQEKATHAIERSIQSRSFMGKKLQVSCLDSGIQHLSLEARQNPGEFAKELLKGVLLHEMGHAWGLAHNFKGSLSYDSENPATFSTSIMDYNQYHTERAAYTSVDSADGPLLEYDRQILSALYNGSRDIATTDAVVPVCNDEETDSRDGGIDPLCIRYDAGAEPTIQLEKTIALVENADAKIGPTQSLPAALKAIGANLGDPAAIADLAAAKVKVQAVAKETHGVISFYLVSGAQSLSYMVRANLPTLYIFREDVLPTTLNEHEMRMRAFNGLNYVANLGALPGATQNALNELRAQVSVWIAGIPAVTSVPEGDRAAAMAELVAPLGAGLEAALVANIEQGVLTRLRGRVIGSLNRNAGSPFYLGAGRDFETETLAILETALTTEIGGQRRHITERLAVAAALNTYRDTDEGVAVIDRVKAKLREELRTATTAVNREEARALIRKLEEAPSA